MSQKKNNGRQFTVDLDDDDDYIDFGSDDDFDNMEAIQNFSLAELLERGDRQREESHRREREERERERLRAETKQNTVTNAGDFFCFHFTFKLIVPKLLPHQSFHTTSASAYGAQQYLTKQLGRNMRNSKCAMQQNYVIIVFKNKLWKKQGCGKRSKGARLDQIGKASPQKRGFLSRGPFPFCQAQAPHL
jgi:hypothetical protein